ncbi:MAG: IPT/TIG domain-containing protein, partial [Actinomycetales bacterium]
FGPLPDNYEFGELGVGTGLRVSLLTGLEQRIEVRYNETLVASVAAPLFKIEASEGAPRNTGGWSQVVVTKSSGGLHIVHDGEQRIHNLTLAQWSPQTYWKFGFGARTSAAVDQHMLGEVIIESDALVEDHAVDVEVTLNGQQFSTTGSDFTYYAAPRVSAFSPTSGPVSGNTNVTVYGSRFDAGLAYRCKFGGTEDNATGTSLMTVPATFINTAVLECQSPLSSSAGDHSLEISIDSHNFTIDAVPFTYYPQPVVTVLSPTGGPVSAGATFITVSGPAWSGGSDYRCKFGSLEVRSVHDAFGNLTCTSPPQESAGPMSVEVTMNGQQFSRS